MYARSSHHRPTTQRYLRSCSAMCTPHSTRLCTRLHIGVPRTYNELASPGIPQEDLHSVCRHWITVPQKCHKMGCQRPIRPVEVPSRTAFYTCAHSVSRRLWQTCKAFWDARLRHTRRLCAPAHAHRHKVVSPHCFTNYGHVCKQQRAALGIASLVPQLQGEGGLALQILLACWLVPCSPMHPA